MTTRSWTRTIDQFETLGMSVIRSLNYSVNNPMYPGIEYMKGAGMKEE